MDIENFEIIQAGVVEC